MDCFLHVCSTIVLLSRYWNCFVGVAYWNIFINNPFYFLCIYPFNCQIFNVLSFNTGRDVNYSSFSYFLFIFYPNYIIQRDSLLFFLKNIIVTIISSYDQVVKTYFFICINSFYGRFSHLSLNMFISTSLFYINNSMSIKLYFCLNCSIRINVLIANRLSCQFSAITIVTCC